MRLARRIANHVDENHLEEVFAAETGFQIGTDPDTVRAPDCSFVRADRLPKPLPKPFLRLAPDLIVETLSPDDRPRKVEAKVDQWLAAGTRLAWIVDPEAKTVTVRRPNFPPRALGANAVLDDEDVLPGFRLELSTLWP